MTREIKEPINLNPVTEVRIKTPDTLIVERTPEKPVTLIETHNINDARAEIAKIDGVIASWQDKRKPYQDIIDEWEAMK